MGTRSRAEFYNAIRTVQALRSLLPDSGAGAFTVHAASSSTAFFGDDYDLLRLGGLLFGDPVALVDYFGNSMTMPGLHRTLLWKSRIIELRWVRLGARYARCEESSHCLTMPLHRGQP